MTALDRFGIEAPSETSVRGYKVRVTRQAVQIGDPAARRCAIAAVLAKSKPPLAGTGLTAASDAKARSFDLYWIGLGIQSRRNQYQAPAVVDAISQFWREATRLYGGQVIAIGATVPLDAVRD